MNSNYGYAPAPEALVAPAIPTLFSVTGDFASIEGKFKINDSLHVECEIGGELDVGGRLVIGENGVVRADVRTVDALVLGTFEGNLVATGNVEIASTGKVTGNLTTDSLVITKGGFFNGNVGTIERPREREATVKDWKKDKKQDLVAAVVGEFRDRLDDAEEIPDIQPINFKQSAT